MMQQLTLRRTRFLADGIFGTLETVAGQVLAQTLEHAYPGACSWVSKVPAGQYSCVRGQHQLAGMAQPFTTFEIIGVPGHTGILFHVGNYNRDSEGCVLLGLGTAVTTLNGATAMMLTNSADAFRGFMEELDGVDSFQLLVV